LNYVKLKMNRSQHPLDKLIQGVTSGIGFATEVREYKKAEKVARKERELKRQHQHQQGQQEQQETSHSVSRSPPPYTASPLEEETRTLDEKKRTGAAGSATSQDEVERSWQLDEAQDVAVGGSEHRKSKQGVANPDKVIGAFLQRQPPPYASLSPDGVRPVSKLAYPVAIPQRRPKAKKRGFIRAYAPDLQNVGIDQETWFDFIETLNEASLANPWINAINLASIAASPLPFGISTAISMAIMVATTVAIEVQSRYR
jgi:hypothetical protein